MFGLSCHVKNRPEGRLCLFHTAGALCELICWKKSFPLSSTRINAGKSSLQFSRWLPFLVPDIQHIPGFNTTLRQYSCRTTDTTEVETPCFLQASVTCWLRLPFASMIYFRPALAVDRHKNPSVRRSWAKRTGGITFRRFGRTRVVNG